VSVLLIDSSIVTAVCLECVTVILHVDAVHPLRIIARLL